MLWLTGKIEFPPSPPHCDWPWVTSLDFIAPPIECGLSRQFAGRAGRGWGSSKGRTHAACDRK